MDWIWARLTSLIEESTCETKVLLGTLREQIRIIPLECSMVPLIRPTVKAAPFTEGCLVMTTKLVGCRKPSPPLRLRKSADRLLVLLFDLRNVLTPSIVRSSSRPNLIGLFVPGWPSVIERTSRLVLRINLLVVPLPGRRVPPRTALSTFMTRCRSVCLSITWVQVETPVIEGAPRNSLDKHFGLFVLLRLFLAVSMLRRAIILKVWLPLVSPSTVPKTSWRLLWQKLPLSIRLEISSYVSPLRSSLLTTVRLVLIE